MSSMPPVKVGNVQDNSLFRQHVLFIDYQLWVQSCPESSETSVVESRFR